MKVKRYGRYLHNFPVMKMSVGYKLTKKVYSQQIQIYLSVDGLSIFDKNVLLRYIPYNDMIECLDVNIADKLQMKPGGWDYFWNNYNIIYINDGKDETYLMFWSNWAGWQKKIHYNVFDTIQEQLKITHFKEFLIKIAQDYVENYYQVPISRIKQEFGLETLEIYRKVEDLQKNLRDPFVEFIPSSDHVTARPKLKIEATRAIIKSNKDVDTKDEVKIPIEIAMRNDGIFTACILIHLDPEYLHGNPFPILKIDSKGLLMKDFHLFVRLKDTKQSIELQLLDYYNNNAVIEGSKIILNIGKKLASKMNIQDVVKSATFKGKDILTKH